MRNIPDRVDPNDPDAPWNDNHPEPDHRCRFCDEWFDWYHYNTEILDRVTMLHEWACPACSQTLWANIEDVTEGYLRFWRQAPDEAEDTIDSYSELRGYEA